MKIEKPIKKLSKPEYMIWWKDSRLKEPKQEHGPIFSKRGAIRMVADLQSVFGSHNAGWEPYESDAARKRRQRYERENQRTHVDDDW